MKYYIYIILSFCLASYTFEANSQNTFYYNSHKSYSAELQSLADSGDPKAINNLGSCYDRGDGIQKDHKKAFELFLKAVMQKDILAYYNLGLYYEQGLGCSRNVEKAVYYYTEAANCDLDVAMYKLGLMHYNAGQINDAKAWFHKAAIQKMPLAMYKLGQCYYVEKNYDEAIGWFEKAANQNFNHANMYLAYIYEALGKDELVVQYFTKAADNGEFYAMDNIASFYLKKGEFQEAVKWLEKAYSNNFLIVCHNLADCYFWGNGVPQSYKKAYEIFNKGKDDNPQCLYRLGMMTRNGQGCTKNVGEGVQLLIKAANLGVGRARYQIGVDYYTGEDIRRDYTNAIKYLLLALEDKYLLDDARGDIYKKLSTCYRFGRGVAIDISKADEYLSEAAKYGNPDATKIQKWLYK